MLDNKLQEALDKINTIDLSKIQTIKLSPTGYSSDVGINDMGFNGVSSKDISTLTTVQLPTLTTAQLSAIGGTSGHQGYTLTGAGTTANLTWQHPNVWATTSAVGATMSVGKSGHLELRGDDADVIINGKSMSDWMVKVEERLNILTPNPELEKEWDDLRRLGERYRKLEKKCKEKAETWNKLKAMPPPRVD